MQANFTCAKQKRIERHITISAISTKFSGFVKDFREDAPTNISNIATDEVTSYFMSVKNLRYLRIAGMVSSVVFLVLALNFAHPFVYQDTGVEAAEDANEEISIDMEVPSKTASMTLASNTVSGDFRSSGSDQKVRANVKSNSVAGYKLVLKGDSDKALIGRNTGDRLESITDPITVDAFSSGQQFNGRYGITLDDNNYTPTPDANGVTIATTDRANATWNEYQVGVGARVNNSISNDIYERSFTMEAIPNLATYEITYGGPIDSGLVRGNGVLNFVTTLASSYPTKESGSVAANHVVIHPDKTPAVDSTYVDPSGYNFVGWCQITFFASNPEDSVRHCYDYNTTLYNDGDSIPLTSANTDIILVPVFDRTPLRIEISSVLMRYLILKLELLQAPAAN